MREHKECEKNDQGAPVFEGNKTNHFKCGCGMIFTDRSDKWGPAKNKWFNSKEDAEYFVEHGKLKE